MRQYAYIGPVDLTVASGEPPVRQRVHSPRDIRHWIEITGQRSAADKTITATFIIGIDGSLWIADRHSEHVQCARGERVLSAGEITFAAEKSEIVVSGVTNQSTGYCPEPESWESVRAALEQAGLQSPGPGFTTEFVFRRCPRCGGTNLVKEGWFECGVCGDPLPFRWNFEQEVPASD